LTSIPPLTSPIDTLQATDPAGIRPAAVKAKKVASGAKSAEAFRQFESFVLQSFIENMLPKNAESVFGKGTAGSVWRSMMAEKIADQISRSGGVGIAERIAAGPSTLSSPASGTEQSAPVALTDMMRSRPTRD
jgi:Rod binding domain-containing protein